MEWFLVWVIMAVVVAMIAKNKGGDAFLWFLYGFAIWPIALTHILLKKPEDFREPELAPPPLPLGASYRPGPPRPLLGPADLQRLIDTHGEPIGHRAFALINDDARQGRELAENVAVALATNEHARASVARR